MILYTDIPPSIRKEKERKWKKYKGFMTKKDIEARVKDELFSKASEIAEGIKKNEFMKEEQQLEDLERQQFFKNEKSRNY